MYYLFIYFDENLFSWLAFGWETVILLLFIYDIGVQCTYRLCVCVRGIQMLVYTVHSSGRMVCLKGWWCIIFMLQRLDAIRSFMAFFFLNKHR